MTDNRTKPAGWDERDYKLWAELRQLRSFGLISSDDRMISLNDVVALMEKAAKDRWERQWIKAIGRNK